MFKIQKSPMELLFVQHGKSLGKSCLKGLRFFSLIGHPGFSFLCYFTRGESVQHDVP